MYILHTTVVANRDLLRGSMYYLTVNFEIQQIAYFYFLIIYFLKKLPFFSALMNVTFQSERYNIFLKI